MPRYEFDPSKDQAGMVVLPKGTYEFIVGEPKSFIRKNSKNEDSYGVRYPLTVADGEKKGTRISYSTYYQSEGGRGMAKQFLMAVLGYKARGEGSQGEEDRFNNDFRGQDWSFDPEEGAVGDAFRAVVGQRVIGILDVQPAKDRDGNETGQENQQFVSWLPISAQVSA